MPKFSIVFLVFVMGLAACNPQEPATSTAPTTFITSAAPTSEINQPASTETATQEPPSTPTPALLPLEIVEWFEHTIPNLADPTITDTQIEVLIRNPNGSPVHVNIDELEFHLLNAAGEMVYSVRSSYFSLWEGSWMLGGEATGFQICACFESSGMEKQEWESLELIAPILPAADVSYTTEVEATLGEPFSLAEAHLGGSGTGIPITLTNAGDQPLRSIPMRVIARDAGGRYIGMAAFGNSVASFTENISIQPGDRAEGVLDSEINYFDGPLTYEVVAIGIPESTSPTEEIVMPSAVPVAEWEGIPIMPGAIAGEEVAGGVGYEFSIQATVDEITAYYETELAGLGYETSTTVDESAGYTMLSFSSGEIGGVVIIAALGGVSGVGITLNR